MMGAPAATDVTQDDRNLVSGCVAKINAKCGHNHTQFEVVAAASQVVAGTNHFYHLKDGDHKCTVTIFEGLGGAEPEVTEWTEGFNPLRIGHKND